MSDGAPPRRIRAQGSPRDPTVMRFILDAAVQDAPSVALDGPMDGVPLAQALFAIDGVAGVQVNAETILVTRTAASDWPALKPAIAAAIRRVLDGSDAPLGSPEARRGDGSRDAALLAAVNEVLDRQANPSIASHGGKVSAERVAEGRVFLRMSGGCQGCASSARTLRQGVETMLRAAVPGIRDIVDVTDHAAGARPYYRREEGQSALFVRPLPPGVVHWDEGRIVIDPDYLAPRLGLDARALEAGLAGGAVVVSSGPPPGDGAASVRVIVRTPERAWAADVAADGSGHEVPPPRPLSATETAGTALRDRVRRHLLALPAERLPISYGRLARALGMFAPGSVRRVTGALEATMHEDAAADRPFVAARVVGRGPGQLPGKGYFELARRLGRGPRPGESDAEAHRRELAESLAFG